MSGRFGGQGGQRGYGEPDDASQDAATVPVDLPTVAIHPTMAIHSPDEVPTSLMPRAARGEAAAPQEVAKTMLETSLGQTSLDADTAQTALLPGRPGRRRRPEQPDEPDERNRQSQSQSSEQDWFAQRGQPSAASGPDQRGDAGGSSTQYLSGMQALAADPPPPGPGELLRFGPGVPGLSTGGAGHAAAVWRGEAAPGDGSEKPPRKRRGWLLVWLVLLLVLVAILIFWERRSSPIAVSGVSVTTPAAAVACGGTATVTGTLKTNGEAGTVTYRWERSDGTVSADLTQQFAKDVDHANVVLLWTFNGNGSLRASATLQVIGPGSATASGTFEYDCH